MESITFLTSLLTFYLKGRITVDASFLNISFPNTVLGIIPLGKRTSTIPINQISTTSSSFRLDLKRFLIGIIIIALGVIMFYEYLNGDGNYRTGYLVVLSCIVLCGICSIINSFEVILRFDMTSGKSKQLHFIVFESGKAKKVSQQINEMIEARLSDTNTKQQIDRIIEAMNQIKR